MRLIIEVSSFVCICIFSYISFLYLGLSEKAATALSLGFSVFAFQLIIYKIRYGI